MHPTPLLPRVLGLMGNNFRLGPIAWSDNSHSNSVFSSWGSFIRHKRRKPRLDVCTYTHSYMLRWPWAYWNEYIFMVDIPSLEIYATVYNSQYSDISSIRTWINLQSSDIYSTWIKMTSNLPALEADPACVSLCQSTAAGPEEWKYLLVTF